MISDTRAVKCTFLFWPFSEDVPSSVVVILSPVAALSLCLTVMSQLDTIQESPYDHGSHAEFILGDQGPAGETANGTRSSGDAGPLCLFGDVRFWTDKYLQPSILVLSYSRSVLDLQRVLASVLSQSRDFWSRPANAAVTDSKRKESFCWATSSLELCRTLRSFTTTISEINVFQVWSFFSICSCLAWQNF